MSMMQARPVLPPREKHKWTPGSACADQKKWRCEKKRRKTAASSGRRFVKIVMLKAAKNNATAISWKKDSKSGKPLLHAAASQKSKPSSRRRYKSYTTNGKRDSKMLSGDGSSFSGSRSRNLHARVSFPWWWTRTTFQYLWFSARQQAKDEESWKHYGQGSRAIEVRRQGIPYHQSKITNKI